MADATEQACRLCLVTPAGVTGSFSSLLAQAASGGDIASLITPDNSLLDKATMDVAAANGIAVIFAGEADAPSGVDGVQVRLDGGDIAALRRSHAIVGVDGLRSRHDAMTAAEGDPDYLFFGRLDEGRETSINRAALDLASWWASVAVVPGVVMGGRSTGSVSQVTETEIEFVALGPAVWEDPRGPSAAVSEVNELLRKRGLAA